MKISSRDTVILFTSSFPYGSGEQFLETEIKYIESNFKNVYIVPSFIPGNKKRNLNKKTIIAKELAIKKSNKIRWKINIFFNALTCFLFYKEITHRLLSIFQVTALKQLVIYVGEANRTYQWLARYIEQQEINPKSTVVYTYWLTHQSLSAFFIKKVYPEIKFVSRAHRFDLYEEKQETKYIPLRPLTIKSLDTLFCISEHGKKYLEYKYPNLTYKYRLFRLGVNDPKSINPYPNEQIFRIVSCSFIVPVKRVELIIDGISFLCQLHPNLLIEWYHFGDGVLRSSVELHAKNKLPSSIKTYFSGQIENHQILEFYRTKSVDVFINLSESEGIPVSIMEAQSYGIPVIATSVGGTPEIVNNNNGILLPANPTAETIAKSLQSFIVDNHKKRDKRIKSKKDWFRKYNAEINYGLFMYNLAK
ncbi:glycosyltransferase [Synechocystis sp. CACIAM 05]|jgi:glycosyltransferase involved in cell wall biosynthesis|uniref:glycosyltransferase n=1 Tax=Synechocystis sp. CACIAM 05 TaxID=1933929 RepID=UPI00138E84B7|nr:glycosyltransferase [Synechocystis sp. CACIAM 05]QHU99978.1 hypothetical protein BWK47_07470 [Synechocystis sp. CACIAM 05]